MESRLPDSIKIEKRHSLQLAADSFISIENDSLQATQSQIITKKLEDFGLLYVKVNSSQSYFVQLIDLAGKIFENSANPNISFKYIPPGDYKIRVLIDSNKNGIWDPPNFYTNDESERVIFFLDPDSNADQITIRPKWELGPYEINE